MKNKVKNRSLQILIKI